MNGRRDFLKQVAMLAAAGGAAGGFPASISRALAIDPVPGSTWLDAEHVVILMQENRSFDHCFGTLRGVRGFNDPRAITQPNGNPVWLQANRSGETYAPFRLNIHDTKATWMSSLPHSWVDQTDARSGGWMDGWLDAKRSGNRGYAKMPLTLGYYDRRDLPFYHAMADAFTICDQNFCSSLTGTTPNRLHLWTGTIRERPSIETKANVRNEDVDYGDEARWTTLPERLEEAGIDWRIYQNEVSVNSGLVGESDAWLSNFTDNPIEWFEQYRVRFSLSHRRHLELRAKNLPEEIARIEGSPDSGDREKKLRSARAELASAQEELKRYTDASWAALSARERSLHERAFTTNVGDPDYRKLTTLTYRDGDTDRRMQVPKGDVFHQFRADVGAGKLPTVSWLVAPENFSDHPGAPWYGSWYVSECLDILTQNPEVWRKTIFILCYDENDGYFDHVPPFVPPNPDVPRSGKVSPGIDSAVEYVRMAQEDERQKKHPGSAKRAGPIGLGFRVPLLIASPWSRGGYVNSQVCDHTSIVRLVENLVSHRTGKSLRETNISAWRRTVCGDLSSAFRPDTKQRQDSLKPLQRDAHLSGIHQAQFRRLPDGFRALSSDELARARRTPQDASWHPKQEDGIRPSCALPYELAVDARLTPDSSAVLVRFSAGRTQFGDRSAGAPFQVYTRGILQTETRGIRSYAVSAGDSLEDQWPIAEFPESRYQLEVHGPNGFFREFRGTRNDPGIEFFVDQTKGSSAAAPELRLRWTLPSSSPLHLKIEDLGYGRPKQDVAISGTSGELRIDLKGSHGWYDIGIHVDGAVEYFRRYAGRIETGADSFSDPRIGSAA